MKAWLVTREAGAPYLGKEVREENKIAAILHPNLSGKRIREIVELICANEQLGLRERVKYARSKKNTPYPAEFRAIDGVTIAE